MHGVGEDLVELGTVEIVAADVSLGNTSHIRGMADSCRIASIPQMSLNYAVVVVCIYNLVSRAGIRRRSWGC